MKKVVKKSLYTKVADAAKEAVDDSLAAQQINVPAIVRSLRQTKGLSGVELCRRAGDLDPKTLTALEKGRIKNPSIRTLESLARGLGVAVSDLFKQAELNVERNLWIGTQKGTLFIDFPQKGVKIVSFTPLIKEFFCGKLIFAPKITVDETLLNHPVPIYISSLVGRVELQVETQKVILNEGENIFFNGVLKHTFHNPLHKESSLLMVMAPSFLR